MARVRLRVNGEARVVEAEGDVPLLWVLRDLLGLTGTKYGCGIGACGACTVLDGRGPVRSCQVPLSVAEGRSYTTVEGLPTLEADALRQAWLAEGVAQCGYCQAGMILRAQALLDAHPRPSDTDIDLAFAGHLCRCGSYLRIRRTIHRAAGGDGGGTP